MTGDDCHDVYCSHCGKKRTDNEILCIKTLCFPCLGARMKRAGAELEAGT